MLISTEIYSFKRWGSNEEILRLVKDSGFEAYDFTMTPSTPDCLIFDEDYKEKAHSLRRFADSIGLICNQTHAPFPILMPSDEGYADYVCAQMSKALGKDISWKERKKEKYDELMETLVKRSLEISGILGAKACVVHPFNDYSAEQNFKEYQKYLPVAKAAGVKIATENMWNAQDKNGLYTAAACSHHDDFLRHLEIVNDEDFVACLDLGHAEMRGLNTDCTQMIYTLKEHLFCLHVHDNNHVADEHKLPYTGYIDFDKVTTALAEVGYRGDITMEAENHLCKVPRELFPQAARYMYEVGDCLRKQIQAKRK